MRNFYLILGIICAFFLPSVSNSQTTVQIGTGTDVPANTLYSPVYRFTATSTTTGSRSNILFTAAEMAAAGIPAGATITSVEFNKTNSANFVTPATHSMYMGNTSNTTLPTTTTWASILSTHTQVYTSASFNMPLAAGWVPWNITPFIYTGGALEIATETSMVGNGGATDAFKWEYTAATPTDLIVGVATATGATLNGTVAAYKHRPNIKITYSSGACVSPPNAGTATSSVTTAVCPGTSVTLGLTGNGSGSGQTYQWQSSPTQNGTYTNIGSSQVSPAITIQPVSSLWYKAAVTCSGNTQLSQPVEVVVSSGFPGGIYTINSGSATGGTNFQSFADAVNAMSCGIMGPVVFNVVAGSGPYTEQITIPQILNASSTNTITFNGNNETIQAIPNTTNRHIIRLDGADYITIKKLNIVAQATSTFGWGIHLTDGANYNKLDSNTINISAVTSTTQSNSAGIVSSGSTTSVTTAGNANYNTISNNTVTGAYQGIIMIGTATSLNNVGNVIHQNEVRDWLVTGIEVTHSDSVIISNNNVHRTNRTDIAATISQGIELGAGNINAIVSGNRIHDSHTSAVGQTGTFYGIYSNANDAPVGSENKFFNNLIYNLNSTSGTIYAIYSNSSNGAWYYHNTVVLNHAAATAGLTRGFYQLTLATNVQFRDNIIYLTRGGTGVKYAIYLGTTTSEVISNNNVLYVNAPAGTNGVGFYSTAFTTLANWQTANSNAYDQQSTDADPQFNNIALADFYPNNSAITLSGANVGVTTDIFGTPRDPLLPTPGAVEILPSAGIDVGALDIALPVEKDCYGSNETVSVVVRNYSASAHNFVTNPVTVHASVSGPNPQTFAPVTISTGTLASGASMNVVLSGSYNMLVAGNYVFDAYTTIAADVNVANDTMPAVTRTLVALDAGTASATQNFYCVTPGTPTLYLQNNVGGNIQWQQSLSATGPWTNVGTNNDSLEVTTPITVTTYFRAYLTCNTNSDTSNVVTISYNNPQVLTTVPGARCGTGTVDLSATATAGSQLQWFETATGGTVLGTGALFTTPLISSNTTYYVSAVNGVAPQFVGAPSITTFPNIGTNSSLTAGMEFTVISPTTIATVDIYPTVTIGTPFKIVIRTGTATGAVVATYEGLTTVTGTAANPVVQTVPVDFDLTPGTYAMTFFGGAMTPPLTGTAVYPGALRNNPATGVAFPYTIPGVISITDGSLANVWYYFYNWQIGAGCESPRQAVLASVSTPLPFNITDSLTVCNNSITTLSVTSNVGDYTSYTWSPIAGLFTDAAATIPYTGTNASTVYFKSSTAGSVQYFAQALNTTTQCGNIDSLAINVLPGVVEFSMTKSELCVTGTSTLTLEPSSGYSGGTIQWFTSPDGITYSPIAGQSGNSYTTPTLTTTTYYKAEIRNSAGGLCLQPDTMVVVNNPQLLTSAGATRCGPGTVVLTATSSAGSGLNWYTTATGGSPIGTGANFTTPIISSTTTYYVTAANGVASQNLGAANINLFPNIGVNSSLTAGMEFTVLSATTIASVDIYPTSPIGTPFKIVVRTGSGTGAVVATYEGVTTVSGTVANPVVQLVPVNFSLNPGVYAMTFFGGAMTPPLTGTAIYPGALRNNPATGVAYPYTIPGVISITDGTAANTWYYFYNWKIGTGCESPRQAVVATVTTAPAFDVSDSTTICNNAIQALSVTSTLSSFNNYVWTPSANLFTDAAATIPYTGGSASTVYIKTATAGTYTYTINALNTTSNCSGIDSIAVTVLPGGITVAASPSQICVSGQSALSITPSTGYTNAKFQWQSSPNGTTFTDITGATSQNYTTPVINATTHYRVLIKDKAGVICQQPSTVITVNSPTVLTTTPAALCGPGTMTLGATGSAGTTLNWYADANGGLSIGSGSSFTTPNLTATDTFYVSATAGGSIASVGPISVNNFPGKQTSSSFTQGLVFDVLAASANIQSVDIFPTTAIGTNFQIVIRQNSGSGAVIATYQGTTTVQGSVANPIAQTVPVNFNLPGGFDYVMTFFNGALQAPLTGNGVYPGALRNNPATGVSFPYAIPNELSITASTNANTWNYFYNWRVGTGCESPRLPVIAQVSANTAITQQPVAQSVCSGAGVLFTVSAQGAGISFQWQKDGVDIPGATNDTLAINNAGSANAGNYRVVITGLCGNATSNTVSLAVSPNNGWIGVISTDWNTAGNWCGGIPTETSDVVITSGTPYSPVVSSLAQVRNLTISSGASLTVLVNGVLNIYGNYSNSGTFNATDGFIVFKGNSNQNIAAMNAGTVIVNGTGGITLSGNMNVGSNLILENGHITLGANTLTFNGSASGSVASHIITGSTGSVVANNVTTTTIVPVGPDAASYNPVTINNGQGRNYTVRVAVGLNPAIPQPGVAVNRTWNITPNTAVTSPVQLTFQYADNHMNNPGSPVAMMQVGAHNGTAWAVVSPASGLIPIGSSTDRRVTVSTTSFGPMVVTNIGGINIPTSLPGIDQDVTKTVLMPNLVRSQTVLRVKTSRATRIDWVIVDMQGRVMMNFYRQVPAGTTDIPLDLSRFANGQYLLAGYTSKGKLEVLKLVKM